LEQITYYQIVPEKFLVAEDVLNKLQKIKRVEHKRVLFARWDYTRYKRIYVDIGKKYSEVGYIDLIRRKFVVTARNENEVITSKLIENIKKKVNQVLDEFSNS